MLSDVHFARSGGYQRWWMWARTIIFCSRPFLKSSNQLRRAKIVKHYNLPSIDMPLRITAFTTHIGITQTTLSFRTRSPPSTSAPFPHKNVGLSPAHKLTEEQTATVVSFVIAVAKTDGIPNPRFCFEDEDGEGVPVRVLQQLPPSVTYRSLYARYCGWESNISGKPVSWSIY